MIEEKPAGSLVTGVLIRKRPEDLLGVHLEVRHGKVYITGLTDEAARNPVLTLRVGDIVFEMDDVPIDEIPGGVHGMRRILQTSEKVKILAQRQDPEASSVSTDSDYDGELEKDVDDGGDGINLEKHQPASSKTPKSSTRRGSKTIDSAKKKKKKSKSSRSKSPSKSRSSRSKSPSKSKSNQGERGDEHTPPSSPSRKKSKKRKSKKASSRAAVEKNPEADDDVGLIKSPKNDATIDPKNTLRPPSLEFIDEEQHKEEDEKNQDKNDDTKNQSQGQEPPPKDDLDTTDHDLQPKPVEAGGGCCVIS